MTDAAGLQRAILAEVASKADLVWVEVPGRPARGMWHVWHDDAVLLVTGGLEQPDPGLSEAGAVELILRSKDTFTRVLRATATVAELSPTSTDWEEAAKALHPKRLNPVDGEDQPLRWRTESTIWRLTPTDEYLETPSAMSADSHRAEPVDSPATTSRHQPFHAGKATRRRR